MALRMVALGRSAHGRWFARKGIPEDVRKEYARLYGVGREAHLKLRADTARHEAKTRLGEWEAEIETRIATLRAQRNGEGPRGKPPAPTDRGPLLIGSGRTRPGLSARSQHHQRRWTSCLGPVRYRQIRSAQ